MACLIKRADKHTFPTIKPKIKILSTTISNNTTKRIYGECTLNNKKIKYLLDTGSDICVVDYRTFQDHECKWSRNKLGRIVIGLGGLIKILGTTRIRLSINGSISTVTAIVIERSPEPFIIGTDVISTDPDLKKGYEQLRSTCSSPPNTSKRSDNPVLESRRDESRTKSSVKNQPKMIEPALLGKETQQETNESHITVADPAEPRKQDPTEETALDATISSEKEIILPKISPISETKLKMIKRYLRRKARDKQQ